MYRSPCEVAQYLAINPPNTARIDLRDSQAAAANHRIAAVGQRLRVLNISRCHLGDLGIFGLKSPEVNYSSQDWAIFPGLDALHPEA